MTAYGIGQEQVIEVLGISLPTLRKYFRHELAVAASEANALVAQKLFSKAIAGDITAMIFWLKCRARWTERIIVGDVAAEGVDPATLSDAELEARIAHLRRTAVGVRPARKAMAP